MEVVRAAVSSRAVLSSVNLAEVVSRLVDEGGETVEVVAALIGHGLVGEAIRIEPFTLDDAVETARLRPLTRHAGLSLADRACLALALRLGLPVLTADSAWSRVEVAVEVRQIR